jgi:DEAD/DEAH box helicase domain-containing protein
MAYTILDLRENLVSLDLLQEVERIVGHRLKLEDIAQATLGVGKTADGLDAIRWWREGKVLEIAKYCCFDVKVTRLVHEYGAANKKIFFNDRFGRKQSLDVDWTL